MLNNSNNVENVATNVHDLSPTVCTDDLRHTTVRDELAGRLNSAVFAINRSEDVLHVDEAALKILLRSKSVKQFNLVEVDRGFDVFLLMTSGEQAALVTVRKQGVPRQRRSVDGFVDWLRRQESGLPPICISFPHSEGGKPKRQSG
jgi:hypothetical protein